MQSNCRVQSVQVVLSKLIRCVCVIIQAMKKERSRVMDDVMVAGKSLVQPPKGRFLLVAAQWRLLCNAATCLNAATFGYL